MISSIQLDRFQSKGYGIKIGMIDKYTIPIPAFAFVDDVDLLQGLKDDKDHISPQEATAEWEDILLLNILGCPQRIAWIR
jgi:hypothetical protein